MTTLTLEQLQKWYRKRLSNKSKDFTKLAERSYKIVGRTLKDVEEVSQDLLEASDDDDIEHQGIASRFAMKISEIVEGFDVDKKVTYSNTEEMQEEIQRFIQDLWGAGARWIKRMDKKHKSTIKVLDSYMKELMREMKKIGKILYEFAWIKDLERIDGRITTLRDLTYGKEIFEEQIRQIRLKLDAAEAEYEAAEKAYGDFKDTSNVAEILNLDQESERVASLLRMRLNTLRKAVKKFTQHDTGVRIGPAGHRALADYFEDPFEAIVEEPDGTPGLLEGLGGMQKAIEGGQLKLKDRLARRAIEEIEEIRNGALSELQRTAKDIVQKRRTYAGSEVYKQSEEMTSRLDEATKNLEYHRNDLLRTGDEIQRQIDKVEEFRERIESEILEAFGEKVMIQIDDLGLEPLLAKCTVS
ncbi:MAG: hypothetical protein JSW61_11575 [Candidatus Thorarchaeota archaeon]|nr:MAG: hypothetical protein JSW61_11575 [Candidatus Thorarchaeota archaeon]